MTSKRHRIVIASLTEQGATVTETKSGYLIKCPDKKTTITFHKTESDPRAEANTRSRVLRAGLSWPFDKH